jgi:hypothetical protein
MLSQVDERQDAIGLMDNRHIVCLHFRNELPRRSLSINLCPMADAVINRTAGCTICDLCRGSPELVTQMSRTLTLLILLLILGTVVSNFVRHLHKSCTLLLML